MTNQIIVPGSGGNITIVFDSLEQSGGSFNLDTRVIPQPRAKDTFLFSDGIATFTYNFTYAFETDSTEAHKKLFDFLDALGNYRGTSTDGLMTLTVDYADVTRTFQGILQNLNHTIAPGDENLVTGKFSFVVGTI